MNTLQDYIAGNIDERNLVGPMTGAYTHISDYPSPSIFSRLGTWMGNWFGGGTGASTLNSSASPFASAKDWYERNNPGKSFGDVPLAQQMQLQQILDDQAKFGAFDKYFGLGPNLATAKLGFDILGGIGNFLQANKSLAFARDQFDWQKNAWQKQFDLAKTDWDTARNARRMSESAFSGGSYNSKLDEE